jgi:hypothetical protein
MLIGQRETRIKLCCARPSRIGFKQLGIGSLKKQFTLICSGPLNSCLLNSKDKESEIAG